MFSEVLPFPSGNTPHVGALVLSSHRPSIMGEEHRAVSHLASHARKSLVSVPSAAEMGRTRPSLSEILVPSLH